MSRVRDIADPQSLMEDFVRINQFLIVYRDGATK
jgi:hypothetical protein